MIMIYMSILKSCLKYPVNRLRVNLMLLFKYSCRESLNSIVLEYWNSALRDDLTTIKRLVDEVHSAASHFHTMFERLSLRIKPGKRRQQTRVNVEYPIPERLDEARRQKPHVTSKTNKIDTMLDQDRNDLPLVLFATATLAFNNPRLNSAFIRGH